MKALVKVCKLLRLKAAPNEVSDQISWELNEKVAGCWSCLALGGLDKSKEEGRASALEAQGLSAVFESLGSRPCHAWLCIMPTAHTNSAIPWMVTLPRLPLLGCEPAGSEGCTVLRKAIFCSLSVLEE